MKRLLSIKHVVFTALTLCSVYSLNAQNFRISGSNTHSVALCDNGTVYAWGENTNGEIGLDPSTGATPATMSAYSQTSYNSPQLVGGLGEIFQIDAGSGSHTLAMTCQGRVYAWGRNDTDQLGNPTEATGAFSAAPVLVLRGAAPDVNGDGYLGGVSYVSGGNDESYAILEDGRLVAWGQNDKGQLGNGNTINQSTPVFVLSGITANGQTAGQPLQNVIQVEAGDENGYALTADGLVWSWGDNTNDPDAVALGRPTTRLNNTRAYPVEIDAAGTYLENIVSITAGDRHALFIEGTGGPDRGTVWSVGGDWGSGQRGNTTNYDFQNFAIEVAGGASGETVLGEDDPIIEVAAGQAHSMAVSESGYIYTWGANGFFNCGNNCSTYAGQLGIGNATNMLAAGGINELPLRATYSNGAVITNAAGVSDGDAWTFLITDDDRVYVAGFNQRGELGINNNINQNRFVELDLASEGCGLFVPCPVVDLGPDFEVCPGFSYDINVGAVYPGFTVEYYLDGNLEGSEAFPYVFNAGPANATPFTVTQIGTWEVRIFDNRTGTQRSCQPCPDAVDQLVISYYAANYDDPGDLTFCGNSSQGNVVESGGALSMTNDYEWYTDQVGGTQLGTSQDEGNVTIDMTTPGIVFTGVAPNRTATVWVQDVSSFTGTLRSNSSCTSGNGTQGHRNQYQITISTEVELTSVDLVANGNNEAYSNLSIIIADNTGTRWDGSANQPYAGTVLYTSPGVSGTTTAGATINIPTSYTLSPGVYWITTSNSPNLRAGCTTTNNTIADPGGGTAVASGDNFTDNGSSASNNNNPFYNLEFVGGSPFPCDRLPFEIVEDCPPCNQPAAVNITTGAPIELCEGDALTIAGTYDDGGNPVANTSMAYVWYKSGTTPVAGDYTNIAHDPSGTGVSVPNFTDIAATVPTDAGDWILRVEDGNTGDASCYEEATITVTVDAQPDLTATDPAAECTPNTVDITGAWSDNNAANTTGAVITYHDGTPAAPGNAITNEAAITTTDTYYVLSTNGECSDEVAVDVTINETPSFTVTDPAAQCAGTVDLSTTVSALSPGAATLTYHSDAAGTSANVNPVSATGTYYIKAVNAGCETIEEVNIVIDAQPDITIAQPAAVCAPNTVDISGVWTDNNTTGASITYHDAIGSTPTTNLVADETAIPTTGTYYVLATNGTCSDEAAVTVTVNALPAKPTTTNFTFCENDALGGAVITDGVTATGSLNWYTAAGGPLGSAPTLSTATPGTTGYGVSQTDGNSCEGDTAMIYVTVNALPTPVISTPSAMCEGDVQTVSVTTPNATSTYAWSVTGAGVSDNGSTTGSIEITAGTGNITVEVTETDNNGCQATSATANIVVDELPPAASVDAATLNVCVVDPISLNGNAAAPGTGTWIKEVGSSATATINTPSSPTSGVTMLGGDVLIATWTITSANGHCPATDATVTVNATAVADPTANLAVDVATICSGDAVTFTATGNNLGSAPTFEFIEAGNPTNVLQADGPSNTYTTGALTADLSVEVIITSNSSCVTPGNESVTSAAVDVTVVTPATADITGYNDADTHTTPNTSESYTAADPGTGYTGTWSLDPMGTTATKVDAGLGTTVSNLEKDMPVELCWTVQDDPGVCASAQECITIENKDLTTPVAGPDDVICVTALPYTRAGNGGSVDPVLETFAWSDDDGAGADVTTDLNEVVIPAGTTPGTYTFTFTITNSVAGSASESFTLEIVGEATADITGFNDGDTHTTPNTSEGYTAADPGTGYTGTWSLDPMGTTATKVDAGLNTTVSNLEKDMPVELCWTVQDDGAHCLPVTECIDIINRDITGAQVTDQTICEEDLPLTGIAPNSSPNTSIGEQAEWIEENAVAAGTIVSEDPTTHVLTLNITAAGTYQYRYRIFNPTILDGSGAPIESSVVMTVQVNATPDATITGAATICDDGSTTNIDISASGSTGPWTVGYDYDNGTTVLGQTANVTTSGTFTFSTDQEGDYTLTSVTDDVTGCTSTPTGSITIGKTALPAIANITSNTATCPALTASETFTANLDAGAGPATSYNWTVNNGTILTGQGTATITVDFSGQSGNQTIEVTPVGCANGTAGTTSITVEQINDPSVSIDPISTLCFDADAKTFTADIDNAVNPSVSWSLDGTFIGAGTNTATGNTLNTFDYYDGATLRIDVTTGNTCTTTPDVFDEVVLSVKQPANKQDPTITDTNFCNIDGPLPMSEGVFVPEPGLQYNKVWYVDKGFGPQVAGVNTSTIQVNETGTYWLEVSHNICPTPTRSEEVSVVVDIQPIVNAGPEVIVEQGEYGTLEGSVIGQTDLGTGIYWSEALPEMNQYAAYTTFFGAGERIREPIVLTAINGTCRADAVTLVTIRPDIYIPKVFTPNGDPENEEWLIKNIEGYPEAKVRIFNRWGNEVWRNDEPYYLNPWDGRRNGTPMPIATYYYIIDFDGTDKEPKQGSVTIIR